MTGSATITCARRAKSTIWGWQFGRFAPNTIQQDQAVCGATNGWPGSENLSRGFGRREGTNQVDEAGNRHECVRAMDIQSRHRRPAGAKLGE